MGWQARGRRAVAHGKAAAEVKVATAGGAETRKATRTRVDDAHVDCLVFSCFLRQSNYLITYLIAYFLFATDTKAVKQQ